MTLPQLRCSIILSMDLLRSYYASILYLYIFLNPVNLFCSWIFAYRLKLWFQTKKDSFSDWFGAKGLNLLMVQIMIITMKSFQKLPLKFYLTNISFKTASFPEKKKNWEVKSLLKVLISKFLGIFIYVSKYVLRNVFAYSYSFVGYTRS